MSDTKAFNQVKNMYMQLIKRSLIVLLLIIAQLSRASSPDSIVSIYKDGRFSTRYQVKTHASGMVINDVADYLVNDFHTAPGHLFTWALKGLGLQDKSNELVIVFKSSEHNAKTNVTHGVFDIVVPGVTTFSNIKVDAIVSKTKYTSGVIKVTANIIYSSLLMKNAVGTVLFVPQKNGETYLITDVDINFGWFFNLFITQKRYKSIVEWRIKKFTENMIDECERRQNLQSRLK